MSSKSGIGDKRGVHSGLGYLQRESLQEIVLKYELTLDLARISLPLHFALAQDTTSMSLGQQRLGVPKVWPLVPEPIGTVAIY
jgi:hypothetical protein